MAVRNLLTRGVGYTSSPSLLVLHGFAPGEAVVASSATRFSLGLSVNNLFSVNMNANNILNIEFKNVNNILNIEFKNSNTV